MPIRRQSISWEGVALTEFLFSLIAFLSHLVQGVTGFGSTVLAVPFIVNLVDPHVGIPALAILSLFFSSTLAFIDRKRIVWREVVKISAHMALGAPVGVFFFKRLPQEVFKPALGTLVVAIALWGLARALFDRCAQIDMPMWGKRFLLVVGGVMQGAFGSSGPFVIFYAESALPDKGEFRTSLTAMWACINIIILPQYFIAGTNAPEVLRLSAISLPAIFLGLAAGMAIHRKINQKNFSLIIYSALLVSGLFNLL